MSDLVFAGESHEFFAPTQFDLIDSLISQYNGAKERINTISGMVTGEIAGAMSCQRSCAASVSVWPGWSRRRNALSWQRQLSVWSRR